MWPKSSYKHVLLSRTAAARKVDGSWNGNCDIINDIPFFLISNDDDVKHEIRLYISCLLTNQKWESALSMG